MKNDCKRRLETHAHTRIGAGTSL